MLIRLMQLYNLISASEKGTLGQQKVSSLSLCGTKSSQSLTTQWQQKICQLLACGMVEPNLQGLFCALLIQTNQQVLPTRGGGYLFSLSAKAIQPLQLNPDHQPGPHNRPFGSLPGYGPAIRRQVALCTLQILHLTQRTTLTQLCPVIRSEIIYRGYHAHLWEYRSKGLPSSYLCVWHLDSGLACEAVCEVDLAYAVECCFCVQQ